MQYILTLELSKIILHQNVCKNCIKEKSLITVLCLTQNYCVHKLTYQEGHLTVCPGWLLVLEEGQWVLGWEL